MRVRVRLRESKHGKERRENAPVARWCRSRVPTTSRYGPSSLFSFSLDAVSFSLSLSLIHSEKQPLTERESEGGRRTRDEVSRIGAVRHIPHPPLMPLQDFIQLVTRPVGDPSPSCPRIGCPAPAWICCCCCCGRGRGGVGGGGGGGGRREDRSPDLDGRVGRTGRQLSAGPRICLSAKPFPPPLENFARRRLRTDFVSGEMRTRIRYREWAWKRVFGCKSVKANPGWIVQT